MSPRTSSALRTLLTIGMDVLIVCAIAVTLRLIIEFFGQLAAASWGKAITAVTRPLVIHFGLHSIKTPYGGVFETGAAVMIAIYVALEWVISGVRDRSHSRTV